MQMTSTPASCRATAPAGGMVWLEPTDEDDRRALRRWCDAVGEVVRHVPAAASPSAARPVVVATWNSGVGSGRITTFVGELRKAHADSDLILMMQEAYREGDPPDVCAAGTARARRIGATNRGEEIRVAASTLSLHAVYVPSMRNGIDCAEQPREDRGNAILSTLPLSDIAAIELPFAQQRRVAVAATVHVGTFTLRVVSVHLDTLRGHRRQAEGLIKALDQLPPANGVIVGGDLNEVRRGGVSRLRKHLAEADCGGLPTHDFPALRLDHLFTRGVAPPIPCVTAASSHGSDHWALIAGPLFKVIPQ
jgi:endonuclease/exonuclease/phosphatase family metal-dependent hydrolase